MTLNEQQLERYRRNIVLEEIGPIGQEKLLSSKVLIIGLGGLGSPAALYLAAAGVGTLGIVDADHVDLTNLQRQILHHTSDLGVRKIDSARKKILAINPDVTVKTYKQRVKSENISAILKDYDFVIDATDNFPAKFLINDACYFNNIAFCHAGVLGFEGQLMTILPGQSACYRCLFESPPPADAIRPPSQSGVLDVVPGVIGTLQATEVIKYLLGIGNLLINTLLSYNALTMEFRKKQVCRNPDCPVCGENPRITKLKG